MAIFGMITTQGSAKYTGPALRSLLSTTPLTKDDHIVLVDNDGHYRPDPMIDHAHIEIVINNEPKGFAANANQLVDRALSQKCDLYLLNNDLIFTPGWIDYVREPKGQIVSPLSNREVNYNLPDYFKCQTVMQLEDYLGKEDALIELVKAHSSAAAGTTKLIALPFFCPRIPLEILNTVGHFDEKFGKGGGEDYDYCLRTHLAGFSVCFANQAFILHFGGKSSYSGVESRTAQEEREFQFRTYFAVKWGIPLTQAILFEDRQIFAEGTELSQMIKAGKHREAIELLIEARPIEILIP